MEDLAEVLLAVGDYPACRHVAGLVAALDPHHRRARDMKRRPEDLPPAEGYESSLSKKARGRGAGAGAEGGEAKETKLAPSFTTC